ncbi:family 43 glycosylhydrolase [Microbacterium sp. X-17]|uniref:family 43 glycosylhydrolase n=1 Tax=Microbacterium sp. X-17 TaxID=3144404 RepID=UPI0031F4C09C
MRITTTVALAIAATFALLPFAPATAAEPGASPGGSPGVTASARSTTPGSYRNPMTLQLPSGETAASCADPSVVHGATNGDTDWYLYCTTDALTATEKAADGSLVMHNVPMYRSADLTHWTYAGDAFPQKPSWLGANGSMWAPDVVFRNGTYYLYYAASDSALPGGGSAVGVATSSSPTGPWTDTGTPVVAPQAHPTNPDARRWEFDPEVITTGGVSYVYFGSYFGGVFARKLSADGLTSIASTETPIAIDNRYEGTNIVQHDGWFYFLGSATNCCAGPLTGYSVFAARSRSPLGPFVDRDGVPILANRVGGTPVLAQNGNRWVGAGHTAVVTDFGGQDWMVYHAVDRNDPYYAGDVGYTKRPVLIDPLDWHGDWPTVRAGAGPSDSLMPGPAAQPGQRTAYKPAYAPDPRPGRPDLSRSTEFDGSALGANWSWVRQPDASSYAVKGGTLTWQTQAADLQPPATPLASVLTETAPTGDYVVETKVSVNTPNDGSVHNYVQGGLIVYGDDGNYVRLTSNSIWDTRQTEFGKHVSPAPAGYPSYGNGVVGPVADWTYLRIVHRAQQGTDLYTAYTSIDGQTWDRGDTWTADLGAHPRIGLISLGGAGYASSFDYVHVSSLAGQQ